MTPFCCPVNSRCLKEKDPFDSTRIISFQCEVEKSALTEPQLLDLLHSHSSQTLEDDTSFSDLSTRGENYWHFFWIGLIGLLIAIPFCGFLFRIHKRCVKGETSAIEEMATTDNNISHEDGDYSESNGRVGRDRNYSQGASSTRKSDVFRSFQKGNRISTPIDVDDILDAHQTGNNQNDMSYSDSFCSTSSEHITYDEHGSTTNKNPAYSYYSARHTLNTDEKLELASKKHKKRHSSNRKQ